MSIYLYILLSISDHTLGRFTSGHSNFEPNEINEVFVEETFDNLPFCTSRSACAFLQANARGVNQQRLCKCSNDEECPLTWDTSDGKSITQGSDQYKFCRKATRLQQCKARQMAYISISTVDKETETYRTRTEKLLCRCSENYYYQYHDMKVMDVDTETRVEEFLYKCLPLPVCASEQICKSITETHEAFLVKRRCNCLSGCPTIGGKEVESQHVGKGMLHHVKCI
ncbi:hypothetical protein QYM36_015875 [Artemia franciscana]|uniref:Uncharacterized protein n=2 Tax=Artemia franciscana TaxID=6661 RepID=A0AA88KXK1_ARTSF|nr:hypothetical protein QYM36_015875 [Artemia franciscana]